MTISGVNVPASGAGPTENLAIAFANTACADAGCCAVHFESLARLLDQLVEIGALDRRSAERIAKTASPPQATRAVTAASRFRNVIIEALDALRMGAPVPARVLAALNGELAACGCRRQVVRDGDAYRTRVLFAIETSDDLLMPLANALSELLTTVDPSRIKQCREERCTCFFVDTSKNRTRTWCSMERCGNRAKVAAYYARSKGPAKVRFR